MSLLKGALATMGLAFVAGWIVLWLTGSLLVLFAVGGFTGIYFGVVSARLARREKQ